MTKEESINYFSLGLNKSLNHPILLQNPEAKETMKQLAIHCFELGWDICRVNNGLANAEEITEITKKLSGKLETWGAAKNQEQ